MDEEFIEEDAQFADGETHEQEQENDELDTKEEGFLKGFEDQDAKKGEETDKEEELTD